MAYFRAKIVERHRKEKISDITRKNHFSTLNALAAFRPYIPFDTLTTDFTDDFDAYLKKTVKGLNTRWGRHKDVKTYLALARKDRMKFENPYEDFKNREEPGQWKPLRPAELEKLMDFYRLCAPRTIQRRVLARFLFSCCSSLRLGDLKNIANAAIENREMTFKAHKTYPKNKIRKIAHPSGTLNDCFVESLGLDAPLQMADRECLSLGLGGAEPHQYVEALSVEIISGHKAGNVHVKGLGVREQQVGRIIAVHAEVIL